MSHALSRDAHARSSSTADHSTLALPSRDVALALYRTLKLIRLAEEELARCHARGLIHGACHTYVGQEAIAAGVCAHLTPLDPVFSTHRGHGHALAKGLAPAALFAELFGRESGCSRGRGGSMHLFTPEIGLMGTSGIVGPCILQAAGGGYTSQLLGTGAVAVAFFGDGAVNNGAFHEGLNLAGIWKLPVLFVCENNQFATEVPFADAAANPSVAARGAAYGLHCVELDGNDVLAIYRAAETALARARQGLGPTLLECKTYRTRPHAEGMGDFTYRTREEVEAWKRRCPIAAWRGRIEQELAVPFDELDRLDDEIAALVARARQTAEDSPFPPAASATTHVYAEPPRDIASFGSLPVATSDQSPRQLTFIQATLEALTHAMDRDPRLFVLGEGIGRRGGNFQTTIGLFDRFGPVRLRDTPIAERGFVGLACGAAMTGSRPIVDFMFTDFLLDSLGELFNQIAKMQFMSSGRLRMPVILRGCIGVGHSAATHHSGSYYGLFAQIPGLRVVVPSNPADAKGLFTTALNSNDPVLFLEHREILSVKGPVPVGDYQIPFGQASIARAGQHVTVVALARMLHLTLSACKELEREGISVEVVDPRTVLPLDIETILRSLHKTGRLLIVDEPPASCGFAAEVAAQVADAGFDQLDAPIRRLTGAFTPTPYSPTLEAAVIPSAADIAAALRALVAD